MTNQQLQQLAQLLIGNTTTQKLSVSSGWIDFLNHSILKCRKDTISYYEKLYKSIKIFLDNEDVKYIEDINKHTLNNMIYFLKYKNLSNNTINKYIEVIKMIVKYNHDNDYISINNIVNFKKLPKNKVEIKTINSNNEILVLKYMNDLDLNIFLNLRNITFMYLFRDTGIRINELLNLETKNIDVNNSLFLAFTKTKDTRHVFYSEDTKFLLSKYLEIVEEDKYLFSDSNKLPMHKDCVYRFLNQIKSNLNITQSVTPHKWRHTLATKLVTNDINLESVRTILGHTTLNTTQKYLHLDLDKIKKDLLKVL